MQRMRRARPLLALATLLLFVLLALDTQVGAPGDLGRRATASEPGTPQGLSASLTTDQTFYSATLNRDQTYTVYLPPGYDSAARMRYPVLYMLHGMGADNHQWTNFGLTAEADHLILTGQITPMI